MPSTMHMYFWINLKFFNFLSYIYIMYIFAVNSYTIISIAAYNIIQMEANTPDKSTKLFPVVSYVSHFNFFGRNQFI